MSVVQLPGEYYGASYFPGFFHRPRRHEARSHGVQAAAEATAGGKEVSRRRFTAHSLELHSPLLIKTGNNGKEPTIQSPNHRLGLRPPHGRAPSPGHPPFWSRD